MREVLLSRSLLNHTEVTKLMPTKEGRIGMEVRRGNFPFHSLYSPIEQEQGKICISVNHPAAEMKVTCVLLRSVKPCGIYTQ